MKYAVIALASVWLVYEIVSLVIAFVKKAKSKKVGGEEVKDE